MSEPLLYLDEIVPGMTFGSPSVTVTEEEIVTFAAQYDPQVFHLNDERARDTFFGRLVASGWNTAALTMRLLVGSAFRPAGGIVGAGFEEFRWPQSVLPGDTLRLDITALETIPSRSAPKRGIVKLRIKTLNQRDEPVQVMVAKLVMQRRTQP
ncbi:MaoC family dehydratase [Stappia taiwanensis]|uniref:MaoC family dehydratase n=1 Tax=Stappia taiwanensis TaxID=992267 RepID=A0A838XN49_9HYPH|nr:MaoC family dehydratase [Stappia taiwanensis]MBA4612699.1 MaoC family dehydratase [Stappia taiwanensis]GGE88369.1 MaoC family dehydratase [Stappia taiwanensis]